MKFYKLESQGNDFIVVYKEKFNQEQVKRLCEQHFSIGADGIIVLSDLAPYDMAMDIYNADGTKAKMCGNGLKIVAYFLHNILHIQKEEYQVLVNHSLLAYVGTHENLYYALVDYPRFLKRVDNYYFYEIGNVHAIKNVEYLSKSNILRDIKNIEFKGVNVSNVSLNDEDNVHILTYENGVGLTNSCGSASLCGFAFLYDKGLITNKLTFHAPGGRYVIEKLGHRLCLYGEVNFIYKGETLDED